MKSKYVMLASVLLTTVVAFAQKNQIKSAEQEFSKGNSQGAAVILDKCEYLIFNASDDDKVQFYFIKGEVLLDLAKKNVDAGMNLSLAAKSYQELIKTENQTGKLKYSTRALASIVDIKGKLINGAIADSKVNKHVEGAKKIYDAYLLDKKDTINLYFAASSYVSGKDYKAALSLYEELKSLGYTGKSTNFYAYNKEKQEEDIFNSSNERDIMVLAGTHERPRKEVGVTKLGEIYRNIALIYVQEGKIEQAKKAISDARRKNPEDVSLSVTEANLYLKTKEFEIYKKLTAAILMKNPNDSDLIFNLGVISANAKNVEEAEKYYKKVMEINPKYFHAYINLAALKLEEEKAIIDEMDKLGTSSKDMGKYKVLKLKRDNLFRGVIPYLIKAKEIEPKDTDVSKTLLSVYNALEMTEEYKALKANM